jgi:hypothetical protein
MSTPQLGSGWVSEAAFNAIMVRSTDQAFGADIEQLTMDFVASEGPPDVVYSVMRAGDRYLGRMVRAWRLTYNDPRQAAEFLAGRLGG